MATLAIINLLGGTTDIHLFINGIAAIATGALTEGKKVSVAVAVRDLTGPLRPAALVPEFIAPPLNPNLPVQSPALVDFKATQRDGSGNVFDLDRTYALDYTSA